MPVDANCIQKVVGFHGRMVVTFTEPTQVTRAMVRRLFGDRVTIHVLRKRRHKGREFVREVELETK